MTTSKDTMSSNKKESHLPLEREVVLSPEKELLLKQAWVYLLQLWGVSVNGDIVFKDAHHGDIDGLSTQMSALSTGSSEPKKKKTSLFGRLTGSDHHDTSRHATHETEHHTRHTQIPYVKDGVHPEFTKLELDSKATYKEFWESLRLEPADPNILRFLKARKWHMDKTIHMIAKDMSWRTKSGYDINSILDGGEYEFVKTKKKGVIKNLELQKAIVAGKDKDGKPYILARPKLHYSSDQTEEEIEKYALLVIEQAKLFLRPPEIAQCSIVFDLGGFSMSNMDYGPVKFLITCFEAHYPECLAHLFIHKAPWIFTPIWNIVKNWLDPTVATKITFTKNVEELARYIDIKQIPTYLGGELDLDMEHYEMPDGSKDELLRDEETRDKLLKEREQLIQNFLKLTAEWIESDGNEKQSISIRNKRALASEKITQNYIQIDPYIRSRSAYDISGALVLQ